MHLTAVALTHWVRRATLVGAIAAVFVAGTAGQDRRQPRTAVAAAATPDYTRVFATDRVHEVRIVISPERFREMQADLMGKGGRGRFPAFGRDGMPGPPGPPGPPGATPDGVAGLPPPRGGLMGGGPFLNVPEPIAVLVSVQFEGRTWENVRMRYKGNSSLMAATSSGNGKVPFRLDFTRATQGASSQNFFGFGKLTFSSNFADESQIREVFATEVLRDRGVPAARAAFYRVVVDTGDGPGYWGLYTMVEDPADGAMLDAQLGGRGANLYKPEGPAANWTRFDSRSFEKKTNESANDFSDVMAAIDALHADPTDRAAWRARLERAFDVDLFLRWLAVNTAIDNWDAYGAIAHNYYLYGDPRRNHRLRWIPWDHNMSFGAGPGGGRGFPGRGPGQAPTFARGGGRGGPPPFGPGTRDVLHRDAGDAWPLITRLLADPEYGARYRRSLGDSLGGLMTPAATARRVRELHALIAPAVVGARGELETHTTISSESAFREAPDALLSGIARQQERIRSALAGPPR